MARAYLELAQAHLKKKDFSEAISFQQKALKVYSELEGAPQDRVAEVAITLSEWLEKAERIEEGLEALKQAEQIYEFTYSVVDKRTCKVKRDRKVLGPAQR